MDEQEDKLQQLISRKEKAQTLYDAAKEDADKIRLLEILTDLEEQIRQEQYKQRLLEGDE